MCAYRVVLRFQDAGLFRRPRKPTGAEHTMITPSGNVNRVEEGLFIDGPADTIYLGCVTNMLRVLFGVRPVPSFRGAYDAHRKASADPAVEELAKSARVLVEDNIYTDEDGKIVPIYEVQMTAKCSQSSWAKSSVPWAGPDNLTHTVSWHSVGVMMGDTFPAFEEHIVEVLGEQALEMDMVSVWSKLYTAQDPRTAAFFDAHTELSVCFKQTIVQGQTKGQYYGHISLRGSKMPDWHWLRERRGISYVNRRSGTITIDINEEMYARLHQGPHVATLLDGGVVTIESCSEDTFGVPAGKVPFTEAANV